MLCALQKVKMIDDRLILIKLSTKIAFLYIETVVFRQHPWFYSYLYIEENKKPYENNSYATKTGQFSRNLLFIEFLDPLQPIFDGFCRKNIVEVR